jgi:hypothetical protein
LLCVPDGAADERDVPGADEAGVLPAEPSGVLALPPLPPPAAQLVRITVAARTAAGTPRRRGPRCLWFFRVLTDRPSQIRDESRMRAVLLRCEPATAAPSNLRA